MSAESDAKTTVQSIEVAEYKIEKLRVFITDRRLHYLAKTASETMHYGVSQYWNKHYNLQSGKTKQLALFQGGGDLSFSIAKRRYKGYKVLEPSQNSHNFRSRNGNKRLVSFTFGKPYTSTDFQSSNLTIHSFPMNLYERDVMLRGWESVNGKIRKGTHILRSLRPYADGKLNSTSAPMLRDIEQRWREMGNTNE